MHPLLSRVALSNLFTKGVAAKKALLALASVAGIVLIKIG